MEGKVKAGQVILKSGVMRTKQKKWCVFYNQSEEVPLLEFYENQDEAKKNSKHKKSHPLKQVKSIDTVNKSSSKDFYIDIHMKKERLTLCFDGEAELEDWSTVLHNYVIITSADGGSNATIGEEDDDGSTFKANMLYECSEDTIAFDVTIEPTPASTKKRLEADKPYRLLVTMTNIYLEDPTKETPLLFRWMYEYIRSYGQVKSTGLFTISAGRRSETGEGEFSFKVANPKAVDQAIDLQTQRKFNLKLQQQHSRADDTEISTDNLRTSTSSKRPVSSPTGNPEDSEAGSRSSLRKPTKTDEFKKALSASIASRQSSDKQRSSKKNEEKDKKEEKEKDKKEEKEKDKKEDKKGGFHLFGKKKDKKTKEQEKECLEPVPLRQQKGSSFDDHIYDEAVPQIQPVLSPVEDMYSDVQKVSGNWKTHGQISSEMHVEHYGNILIAGKENKNDHKKIPLPPNNDDDDDEMYDTLEPKGGQNPKATPPEESLYGSSSGRLLSEIPTKSTQLEEETYDDVVSVQSRATPQVQYSDEACEYETVDVP